MRSIFKKIFVVAGIFILLIISIEILAALHQPKDVSEIDQIQPIPTPRKGYIDTTPVGEQSMPYRTTYETTILDDQKIILYRPSVTELSSSLIIYSHGSNEHIDPTIVPAIFEEALPNYGTYFAQHGSVFVVSELYGENWGTSQSQIHVLHMIDHFKETYPTIENVYIYGFSMGGLTALRTIKRDPSAVNKVALLAPTISMDDWTVSALDSTSSVPITIWHGTSDVNVPYSLSVEFTNLSQEYGHTNVTLIDVPGETHRHFLSPEDIWQFFTQS